MCRFLQWYKNGYQKVKLHVDYINFSNVVLVFILLNVYEYMTMILTKGHHNVLYQGDTIIRKMAAITVGRPYYVFEILLHVYKFHMLFIS